LPLARIKLQIFIPIPTYLYLELTMFCILEFIYTSIK